MVEDGNSLEQPLSCQLDNFVSPNILRTSHGEDCLGQRGFRNFYIEVLMAPRITFDQINWHPWLRELPVEGAI